MIHMIVSRSAPIDLAVITDLDVGVELAFSSVDAPFRHYVFAHAPFDVVRSALPFDALAQFCNLHGPPRRRPSVNESREMVIEPMNVPRSVGNQIWRTSHYHP